MAQTIYNEGRVVGYSSYEVYVKQSQAIDPETEPATERQWLASSLAMGSSMLFHMPKSTSHDDDEVWMYEVDLPEGCRLCAANSIMANFFTGDAELLSCSDVWASKVTDYGDLIENDDSAYPSGDNVPSKTMTDLTDTEKTQLATYLKIQDGIIYQPGTWTTSSSSPPKCDFKPDLSKVPKMRLQIKGKINESFWMILTGFTNRIVVMGETGLDGSVDTPSPEDGDFLGPEQFPWSSKILFSVSTVIANEMRTGIGAGSKNVHITVDPDSFETYISVDNVITSDNPYLTVTQTNDGGNTTLSLDGEGLVRNSLEEGPGITIGTGSNNKVRVQTNLEGGTGITITQPSSSSTKLNIATNIKSGSGISITTDSNGQITITNSAFAAEYENLSTNRSDYTIYNDDGSYSKNYCVRWYNNFYGHRALTDDDESVWSDNLNGTSEIYNWGPYLTAYGHGTPEVYISPSYTTDSSGNQVMSEVTVRVTDNLTTTDSNSYISFGGRLDGTHNDGSYNFRFRHTQSIATIPQSRLFSITFPSGTYSCLSDTSTSLLSTDCSASTWNVRYYDTSAGRFRRNGFSWQVQTSVNRVVGNDGSNEDYVSNRVSYVVSATSISDGYNNQYDSDIYEGYRIFGGALHVEVKFTVKVN